MVKNNSQAANELFSSVSLILQERICITMESTLLLAVIVARRKII